MSTGAAVVALQDYLTTSYRPDREYLEGELLERNVGEWDHSKLQARLIVYFSQLSSAERERGLPQGADEPGAYNSVHPGQSPSEESGGDGQARQYPWIPAPGQVAESQRPHSGTSQSAVAPKATAITKTVLVSRPNIAMKRVLPSPVSIS